MSRSLSYRERYRHESDEDAKGKGKGKGKFRDKDDNDEETGKEDNHETDRGECIDSDRDTAGSRWAPGTEGDQAYLPASRAYRTSQAACITSATMFLTDDVFQTLSSWAHSAGPADIPTANREVFKVPEYLFILEAVKWEMDGDTQLSEALGRFYLLVREFKTLTGQDAQARFISNVIARDRKNREAGIIQRLMGHVRQMGQSQHRRAQASDELSTDMYAVSAVSADLLSISAGPNHQVQRNSFHTHSLHDEEVGNESRATQYTLHGFGSRDSKWFSLGRVFITPWHTSATAHNGHMHQQRTTASHDSGDQIFSEVRRFVVVRECHGFCWAVPVSTYRRQGVGRRNFTHSDIQAHAIIYMADTDPTPLPLEPKMNKKPIAVEKTTKDQKLHPASRIRFDKVFTIEHNVKVKNCGKIDQGSMAYFRHYFKQEIEAAKKAM